MSILTHFLAFLLTYRGKHAKIAQKYELELKIIISTIFINQILKSFFCILQYLTFAASAANYLVTLIWPEIAGSSEARARNDASRQIK